MKNALDAIYGVATFLLMFIFITAVFLAPVWILIYVIAVKGLFN